MRATRGGRSAGRCEEQDDESDGALPGSEVGSSITGISCHHKRPVKDDASMQRLRATTTTSRCSRTGAAPSFFVFSRTVVKVSCRR
eukprot:6501349-Pyramimonas_sp.AAC.1